MDNVRSRLQARTGLDGRARVTFDLDFPDGGAIRKLAELGEDRLAVFLAGQVLRHATMCSEDPRIKEVAAKSMLALTLEVVAAEAARKEEVEDAPCECDVCVERREKAREKSRKLDPGEEFDFGRVFPG